MKYCEKCGAQIRDESVVCPYCGCTVRGAEEEEDSTIATLAIVFGALGGWLGLVLGLVGLSKYKSEKYRKQCKIGIILFVVWVVLGVIIAIVFYATIFGSIAVMSALPCLG